MKLHAQNLLVRYYPMDVADRSIWKEVSTGEVMATENFLCCVELSPVLRVLYRILAQINATKEIFK